MLKLKRDLPVLVFFITLSLVMRFFSFFPSVISHDEATFLVIAREMLHGKMYFVDVVDTKPVGIFLILAGIIKVFGTSIFIIRLITALVVALTSFVIYKISLFNQADRKPAVASGVILIFFLSVFSFFGVTINPELYYLFFTAVAFYIFLRWQNFCGFFFLGLLLGAGFMIKYVVLFDLATFLLYYFITRIFTKETRQIRISIMHCITACIGFLIPFAVTFWYYYRAGYISDFIEYTFKVTSRYPVDRTFWETLRFIGDFHLRFLPMIFFFYYMMFRKNKAGKNQPITKPLMIIWCLLVLLAILAPGKPFGHYFIQMMLPVSIWAGQFFSDKIIKPALLNRVTRHPMGTVILGIVIVFNVFMQKHDYYDKPDQPREVSAYLKTVVQPGDQIYTGNYQQILYYLLDKDSPTKYIHRTLLCNPEHRDAFQIDLPAEMKAIMDKNIRFIVMQSEHCYGPFNQYLSDYYRVLKTFPGEVVIYERQE